MEERKGEVWKKFEEIRKERKEKKKIVRSEINELVARVETLENQRDVEKEEESSRDEEWERKIEKRSWIME